MPKAAVNGAELHYTDEGTGQPVVFVHGVWMSGRFFDTQRPYFRHRYRTIVLDLRGHGQSEHVHEGHTVPQYARDLKALLGAIDAPAAVLVGWSMGALVIWELIDQFGTEEIRAIVCVDQSPSDYRWPDWPHGFLDFDGLCHAMAAVQEEREPFVRSFIPLMFDLAPSDTDAAWMIAEIMRPPASVASAIIFDQTVRDYRQVLPKVDVPALVCAGSRSKLMPMATQELLASEMPDARLVVFEKSGHCPFLEEPERFNEELDLFVASLETR
jgi:pimeloyl-ACP methyl ester carboxylesterase